LIEEYCRFELNSSLFTDRIKHIRHKICALIDKLDTQKLLTARNVSGDVGAAKQIKEQMERGNLKDSFTAACKRLTEALRVLSEMLAPFEKHKSQQLEKLRFQVYSIEKDIVLFADSVAKFDKVKLYIIITSDLHSDIMNLTGKCIKGGADCIQLRAKHMPDNQLYAASKEMVKLCRDENVISIINDRADIAAVSGADGIHLGQNDIPIQEAERLAFKNIVIGKSTHNINQLEKAIIELPTYVGLGPVFPTTTKANAESVGLKYVKDAILKLKESGIRHVAIGGINSDNIEDVLKAGANAVAVCSTVTKNQNPTQACKFMKQKICNFKR
jgi:thiamine-phosphate pyrophosphorylase